jgi:uncharacterized repeat protein (TIGR01451 family)
VSQTHRMPRLLVMFFLLLSIVINSTMLFTVQPSAQAAIDNNEPTQPFAAYGVDCVRTAADRGLQPHQAPRFAATCYGSAWQRDSYEFDTPSNVGDAPRTDPAVIEFGDGKVGGADGIGEPGHVTRASLGTNGTADGGLGLGAVYGLAYSSGRNPNAPATVVGARSERTFVGAYTKRITRFGAGGPGAVYVILADGDEQVYVTVPDVVPGPNGFPGDPGDGTVATFPNAGFAIPYSNPMGGLHSFEHDEASRPWIAKTSLGDIELTNDERYLVVLNLNTRALYRYDTWNANPQSTQASFAIPAATAACPGGAANFRPFALDYSGSDNSLLVGYVCSAETSQDRNDLRAGVLRLSTTGAWSRVLDFALTAFDSQRVEPPYNYAWQPWSSSYSNEQPIVADLELTERGELVIGMRDRTGDIGGTELSGEFGVANGDMLLATPNGAGGWNPPSSATPEYFRSDHGYNDDYREAIWGATAYVPGQHDGSYGGEILATHGFPYREETGGVGWFNARSGTRTAREELYRGGPTTLAKAAGLGDVELLCVWRAIGNRVWNDANANGVQDTGEASIPGVRMQLVNPANPTQVFATVTTGSLDDANDQWRFYIPPWQPFMVRVDPTMFNAGQPLAGYAITTANAGSNDGLDSDANTQGQISIPAADHSNVDLSFDVGVVQSANILVDKQGPATANAGQQIDYTITVTNQGPAVAANVQAVDTLPASVSFVSATPAPTSQAGQTLTWNLGSLNAGATTTITVRVQVGAGFSGTLTNQVQVTTTTPGDTPGDNTDTVITTVNAPNIAVTKSCPATVAAGQNVTYTIGYQNTGSGTFVSLAIRDILPAGMTYVSGIPTPVLQAGNPYWLIGSLGPGQGGTLTVVARAEASIVHTSVTNLVELATSNPSDTATVDNTASCTTQVLGANVRVAKNGPTTVVPGADMAYTITATNDGPASTATVVVRDTLPPGVTFVSASPTASVAGQVLTWDVGSLAAGESRTFTVQARADTTLAGGIQLVNTAQITTTTPGDEPDDNTSTVTTTVIVPNVYILKDGPTIVVAGNQIQYTLTVGNNGAARAYQPTYSDTLPAGLTFVSATPAPSVVSGQTLTWNTQPTDYWEPGTVATITVIAQVDPSLANGASLTNTTNVTTTTPGDNPGDNTDTAITTVQRADVRITKSSPTTFPVSSGQQVTFYLDYTNAGPAPAENVVITDTVPGQITNVTWTCASGCTGNGTGSTISVNIGTLAAGSSGRITVIGTATTTSNREEFVNIARITTSTPESDSTNNESSAPGAVWTTDLQIVKNASAQVVAGMTFTATLNYRNNGPAPAINVNLIDNLPTGVTFVNATPPPASQAGQTLIWNLNTLADQASGTIALTLRADHDLTAGTSLVNRASISTSNPDRDSGNNQDDASTIVLNEANLRISKTGPAQIEVGQTITYTLNYTNQGPSVARNTIITDTLPAELTFMSATPAPTSVSGNVLSWNIGGLNPGATGNITVVAGCCSSINPPNLTITNQARIGSATPDPDRSNNEDDHQTLIQTADVWVRKTASAASIVAGDTLTYTLQIANDGPATARNVVLTDTLPLSVSLLRANPAPTSTTNGILVWNVGTLTANQSRSYTLEVQVDPALRPGSLLNQARITTTTPDRDLTNNESEVQTPLSSSIDLRISKDDGLTEVQPGDVLTYTIAITNGGSSLARGVVVREQPPQGAIIVGGAPWRNVGNEWLADLGDLGPGDQQTLTFTIRLPIPFVAATLSNRVEVEDDGSGGTDTTPGDNSDDDQDLVISGEVGDRIWFDANDDGLQGTTETGVEGVLVQLLDPTTLEVIAETLSGADGIYSFAGLRLGNYAVQIAPTALQSGPYAGYRITSDPMPTAALTVNQPRDQRLDIGINDPGATEVTLASFSARDTDEGVLIRWHTVAEQNNAGYRLLRATTADPTQAEQIGYVRSQGSNGGRYEYRDPEPPAGPVFYWLVAVEFGGRIERYGPVTPLPVTSGGETHTLYLPMVH